MSTFRSRDVPPAFRALIVAARRSLTDEEIADALNGVSIYVPSLSDDISEPLEEMTARRIQNIAAYHVKNALATDRRAEARPGAPDANARLAAIETRLASCETHIRRIEFTQRVESSHIQTLLNYVRLPWLRRLFVRGTSE